MQLTFEEFKKMEEIDHQYFPDENISSADAACIFAIRSILFLSYTCI